MKANFRAKKRGIITILLSLAMFFALATQGVIAEEIAPTVTSDKIDYVPGETVTLQGAGWTGDAAVQLTVEGVSIPGEPWKLAEAAEVQADGTFVYQFSLPYLAVAQYQVTAVGTTTARTAVTTFTDTSRDFKQFANEPGAENWIGSALNRNKSVYYEGMSVPQRIVMTGIDTSTSAHQASFEYQFTKGGKYAYDFITSWNQAVAAAHNIGEQSWSSEWKWMDINSSLADSLKLNHATASVPDGTLASAKIAAYEGTLGYGNRVIDVYANAPISNVTITIGPLLGDTSGDSSYKFTVTWEGTADKVMILYASHVSVGLDPIPVTGIGWGAGMGASAISGACYHNMLADPSSEWTGASEDNQMMSDAVLVQSGIYGMKFLDENGNGAKDAEEPGLEGWTIWLDLNDNGVKDPSDPTATTAADGTYHMYFFLPAGSTQTLNVYEVQQSGYLQTYPASGYNEVVLSPGYVAENVNFGNMLQNPHISLTKVAAEASFDAVGDVIHYTLVATNDGNVTLHDVTITDPLLGTLSFTPASPAMLAPGATLTATGTHIVTQADLDAGHFYNIATATGLGPEGQPVSATADEDVPAVQNPHISLTKTAAEASYDEVGDVIHYTLVATNDGNVTLHNVTITDPLLGTLTFTPAAPATLAPGAALTATGTHTVTQADLDAGHFYNIATATGLGPKDQPVSDTADEDVPAAGVPHISLTKTAAEASYDEVGDVIHYTLVATNDGNVTLHNVTITDPLLGMLTFTPAAPATLAPGATLTATGTHIVTQADLDAGHFYNIAAATGLGPQDQPVSDTADENVPAVQNPHISLTKVAAEASYDAVGDVIHYTLVATNDGNVTLHNVMITDPLLGTLTFTPEAPAILLPGQTLTATGTHIVTQADLDAGHFYNIAAATGHGPKDQPVSDTADEDVPAVQNPHISLTKIAAEASYDAVGDVIHYTITATNDGNVTLYNVMITDPLLGELAFTPEAPATLAPGETLIATGTHTVTQADLDAGHFYNISSVTAIGPDERPVEDTDDEDVPAVQNPGITIDKTTNGGDGKYIPVGGQVTWTYLVTNTGNVTLTNVIVTDSDLGEIGTIPILDPGASATLTKTGTAVAGLYENTGTAVGTPPEGEDVSDTDDSSYFGSAPDIMLVKTVKNITTNGTAGEKATGTVGDDFLYTLVVTNTGNVALSNVVITDNQAKAGSGVTVNGTAGTWTAGTGGIATVTIASLEPNQSVTITYTFETAPDGAAIAARINTAHVDAVVTHTINDPAPVVVSDEDQASVSTVLGVIRTGEVSDIISSIAGLAMLMAADGLIIFLRVKRTRRETAKR